MDLHDAFRPRTEPTRTFYDAIWKSDEEKPAMAAWRSARDYAQQHGLQVLTLAEVTKAETVALGHVDYAAKFAYALVRRLGTALTDADGG